MKLVPDRGGFNAPKPVLSVEHLTVELRTSRGQVRAVDDVSFELYPGETLGLVGKSGSGKSLTCLSLLRLLPEPVASISAGQVLLDGKDLLLLSKSQMRRIRGQRLSIILQDPMTSLNPVLTIGDQIGEAIRLYRGLRGGSLRNAIIEAMHRMGISGASDAHRSLSP